jgi:hypothetical protein
VIGMAGISDRHQTEYVIGMTGITDRHGPEYALLSDPFK